MSRPQIQEEAVEQLADELEGAIEAPRALAVVIRAKHLCCGWRGVKDDASLMTTSVMRGLFKRRPEGPAGVPGPHCWHGLLMIHRATKTYGHDLGLSVAFRQWRADSHCRYLHGYAIGGAADVRSIRTRRTRMGDRLRRPEAGQSDVTKHFRPRAAGRRGRSAARVVPRGAARDIAQVFVVSRTGCEAFASTDPRIVSDWLRAPATIRACGSCRSK